MIETAEKIASGIVSQYYHMYGLRPDITVCSLAENVHDSSKACFQKHLNHMCLG